MRKLITLTLFALLAAVPVYIKAQCSALLEGCAKGNPGAMSGFTLVDAAYDDLDAKGGKLKITMYSGSTYRFLTCKEDKIPALVMALADGKGNVLATNLTEDEKGVYRTMEVTCTATGEYTLVLMPYNGIGCGGIIYAMKQ